MDNYIGSDEQTQITINSKPEATFNSLTGVTSCSTGLFSSGGVLRLEVNLGGKRNVIQALGLRRQFRGNR